jgi:hypothetical protein
MSSRMHKDRRSKIITMYSGHTEKKNLLISYFLYKSKIVCRRVAEKLPDAAECTHVFTCGRITLRKKQQTIISALVGASSGPV